MVRRRSALASVLGVALLGSGFLFGVGPKPVAKGKLPVNWSKLGLSDDQKEKIYRVRGEYQSKIEELQLRIRQLQREERLELEKVLTDSQKKRLREILASKGPADPKDERKPEAGKDKK
jgi:hypothetical protein